MALIPRNYLKPDLSEPMIIRGERVRQARELKGWTQSALANSVGVSQAAIAQIELGAFIASDELIAAIANKTGQPIRFFYKDPPPEFPSGSLLFRAHASLTRKEIATAHRHAERAYELWTALRKGLTPIPVKIPRDGMPSDPVSAARKAREVFGVPQNEPIPHLLNVLEWSGVVVLLIPNVPNRDAFSLWFDDLPIMALSSGRPGDRSRMNTAHELAHLTLHVGKSRFEVDDSEADDFAAEFLMPEEVIRREIVPPVTISSLAALKPRWGVSIQALAVRAKSLGLVTERQYRYLFEQISAMGWRKAEPVPIMVERPRALRQMAEIKYGDPIDYNALAAEVCIEVATAKEMLAEYAPRTKTDAPNNVVSLKRRGRGR
jgi:Zn-dependent peptidase ImmA (M78 family)/DNA-binding XRE family transcriptional regulator